MPLFHLSNLPYWIFLGLGVSLFLFVILAGGGDDTDLDADIDADVDADLALDAEGNLLDLDTDAEGASLTMAQMVAWLGIGRAPLILLLATDLSIWGLLGWMLNVFIGGILGNLLSGFVGVVLVLISLVGALLLGGQIAKPIGKVFASFGEDVGSDRLIGCIGTVSTAQVPIAGQNRIGQVDVLDPARNRVTVNAILPEWATVIPQRGAKVLVIERTGSSYLVIVKDSPDQDQWFSTSHSKPSR
ncbi:DUF1449 family protein [Oscillatoria sp. FACHB-1407]|uniref:OB-fold-containig protein n=1 Tax=Oscillatoria sp. FACHB-1407 TaxID=2692847 RepID=UPI001688CCD1|nr:OB-fold-containig protein [Oscillatoria sp. FACHB-1407]MBD2464079.1 DUF1449 family protein [Oscillatoria sp. FACHB-1407]